MSTIWALWDAVVASAICDLCCGERARFATVTVQMGMGKPCQGLYGGTGSRHYGREAGLFHNSDSYLPGHAHGPQSRVSRWLRGRLQRQQEDDIADHGSGQLDAVAEHRGFQRLCPGHCNCGHTHHTCVDQLADRTGLGEATAGAVLLGAATSLSGSVLSVTAAYRGHPELAASNALGGIAVQTFFLAIADMVYRRANLEHAAASAPNMMQNGLLIRLLAIEKHASETMIDTRLEFQGDGTASRGLCLRSEGLTGATQCFIV